SWVGVRPPEGEFRSTKMATLLPSDSRSAAIVCRVAQVTVSQTTNWHPMLSVSGRQLPGDESVAAAIEAASCRRTAGGVLSASFPQLPVRSALSRNASNRCAAERGRSAIAGRCCDTMLALALVRASFWRIKVVDSCGAGAADQGATRYSAE